MTDRKSTAELHAERLQGRKPPPPDSRPTWERHADRLRPAPAPDTDTTEEQQ